MEIKERQESIHDKGFRMRPTFDNYQDYAKMRVGVKTVQDAILNLNPYKKANGRLGDRDFIIKALANHDYDSLREISNLFISPILAAIFFTISAISSFPGRL